MDKQINETLNIGTEVRLAEGIVKNIRIGSIGLIRKVRQLMKGKQYSFSYSIGRDVWTGETDGEAKTIDFPAVEAAYREAFNLVLVDGLTDAEYDQVDEKGIEELEMLLSRFL